MIGYSPKFPLQIDNYVGAYSLNTTLAQVAKQNFFNLVLTSPGERIMDINFGVGLRRYLFEQNSSTVREEIATNIQDQVRKYMPFISLKAIDFNTNTVGPSKDHILKVSISYSIPSIVIADILEISETFGTSENSL